MKSIFLLFFLVLFLGCKPKIKTTYSNINKSHSTIRFDGGGQKHIESNKELSIAFNKFYKEYIKLGAKDDLGEPYYNKIDMISAIHTFDFSNNGEKDVLIEFSVARSDGGTAYELLVVLFQNTNSTYYYVSHTNTDYTVFEKFENNIFHFKGVRYKSLLDENRKMKFKLVANRLLSIE